MRVGLIWAGLLLGIAVLGTGRAAAIEMSYAIGQMYAAVEVPPPTDSRMTVCYGFVCRLRFDLTFTDAERKLVTDMMNKGRATPADERKAIQQAFVWWDHRVAQDIGSQVRVANADVRAFDADHNFDCWDTTRNAASFLLVMQTWGVLRHHRVSDPRYRGNVLIGQLPHNTAVIREIASGGTSWVVDQWTTKFGQVPDVMPLEQWLKEI